MRNTFLRPVKGQVYPGAWWSLCAASTPVVHPDCPDVTTEHLVCWSACGFRTMGTGKRREVNSFGHTEHAFWHDLQEAGRSGGQFWVFAFDMARTLALVGFWPKVESGAVYLTGDDPQCHRQRKGPDSPPWSGYAVLADPPTVVHCRLKGCNSTVRFVDLRNYGLDSIADLSEYAGGRLPRRCPEPNEQAGQAAWAKSVAAAGLCFVDRMVAFLRTEGLGSLQATAGSQALHSFRRAYLKDPIHLHGDDDVLGLEGEAYHSGRCEAFMIGKPRGTTFVLDFNSLYPSVCVGNPLPCLYAEKGGECEPERLREKMSEGLSIAEVELQTSQASFPVRRGDVTVWPRGKFTTALCGPELIEAFEQQAIRRVLRWARYDGHPALSDYSRHLYAHRKRLGAEYGTGMERLCKAMLVALPGKFGQRSRRWIPCPAVIAPGPYLTWFRSDADVRRHSETAHLVKLLDEQPARSRGRLVRFRSFGWAVEAELDTGWAPHACPAVAAWITSLGRVALLRALRVAGRGHVYYCDTDSLHCDSTGYERLRAAGYVQPDQLGYLRLETMADQVEYFGWKHYTMDGRLVCSGLPRVKVEAALSPWEVQVRTAMFAAAQSGHRPEASYRRMNVRERNGYRHGLVQPSGWVHPFVLG